LEEYSQWFDGLFCKVNQREGFRQYLTGLLLASERNKTLTGIANSEPVVGAQEARVQSLQWYLSESTWEASAVNRARIELILKTPGLQPNAQGALVIDETGDRKAGHKTAHVGRQYLANLGKIDNGVVSVTSLWADEKVYYPLDVEPYTPAAWFEGGKANPAFRTKLKIATELVEQALQAGIPFRAVVADSFYGEDRTFRQSLDQLGVGYVLALKPSFAWWHRVGDIGSPQAAAQAAVWAGSAQPGDWVSIERTFHDGHAEQWWALEVVAGPFGPDHALRSIVVTTDPATLPDLTTWYLITNLPAPGSPWALKSALPAATLAELVRLYGLRNWVEQSYKQVKHTLGWAHYQVRSDTAIRRHWTLVCCAFTFCWWQAAVSHLTDGPPPQKKPSTLAPLVLAPRAATGPGLARPLHHAQSLLDRLFAVAPATSLATPA
jgi:SRSO17 transposase